jgi:hypothetical protein
MNDQLEKLFGDLRAEAMQEIQPPSAVEAMRTVRRRRGIFASAGAVVAVAAVATGIAVSNGQQPHGSSVAAPSASVGPDDFPPQPDPRQSSRLDAADKALGDPKKLPWVMATGGVVSDDYENAAIDLPADDYRLFVYCAGPGTVDVVVKEGWYSDTKLAAGRVTCSETPQPGQLSVKHPVDGRMRLFLKGDAQANGTSAFSFKFVREAEFKDAASPTSAANAGKAAELLAGSGVPGAKKMTTETNKTGEEPLAAGDYLAGFACAGPGKVSFIVRSAPVLRDGTVSTEGQTETATSLECTAAGKLTKDVPMTLPAGSAFTITAEADAAAHNKAGWAYSFRPA